MTIFQETAILLIILNILVGVLIVFSAIIYGWIKRIAIQLGYAKQETPKPKTTDNNIIIAGIVIAGIISIFVWSTQ